MKFISAILFSLVKVDLVLSKSSSEDDLLWEKNLHFEKFVLKRQLEVSSIDQKSKTEVKPKILISLNQETKFVFFARFYYH